MGRLLSFLLFILQIHVSLCASLSSYAKPLCQKDQSLALLQFKQNFQIDAYTSLLCEVYSQVSYPKTNSWNKTADCCSWDGVTCDEFTGQVIGLDLSCSQLRGQITSNSSLFHLSHLQRLNLAGNQFWPSKISQEFGSFQSLTYLNLSDSGFSGQVPNDILHLSRLITLDLSYCNELSLEPQDFKLLLQNFTQLREIFLSNIFTNSVVPRNLSSSLETLSLRSIGLHGEIPDSIFYLPNLQRLFLGGNSNLTGQLERIKWNSTSTSLRELILSSIGFSGKLPDSIGNLKSLDFLDLSLCNFSGSIPESLGNLTQLNYLVLSYNNFFGDFPSSVTKLKQLIRLGLSGNSLSGPLPLSITGLQNLTNLDLSYNSFNGTIPSWLFTIPSLQILDLQSNQLTGQIDEFQSNKSLTFLMLGHNMLHGAIPKSLSKLVNLSILDLTSNNFNGPLEVHVLSNLKQLGGITLSDSGLSLTNKNGASTLSSSVRVLSLSSCEIQDLDFLRDAKSLDYLDLSRNKIAKIPEWAWSNWKTSMRYLNLSANFLTRIEHLNFDNLDTLDLRSNLLHGPLPTPPFTTSLFFISHNKLTGEIPSSICNSSSLEVIDLSNNNLSGMIPNCVANLSRTLSVLDMHMNKFEGLIPAAFEVGNYLRSLNLHSNKLEGELPRSLANCRHLEVLNLGNNSLNGTFPRWLGTLPNLQVLSLRSNKLHGQLSTSWKKTAFPKLRILDLSFNEFNGTLPPKLLKSFQAMLKINEHVPLKYIGNVYYQDSVTITGMLKVNEHVPLKYIGNVYYQDSVTITGKGLVIELVRILSIFTTIDISCNKFEGEIPDSIGNLHYLRGLNLSHNNFRGQIPPQLGNLSKLESLDLSSNQLGGEIPGQLTTLCFLSTLNVSYNHLIGRIPQGQQFDSFNNDTYRGNAGLCGNPLSKHCEQDEKLHQASPSEAHEGDVNDCFDGFSWKSVITGYAFGVVVGISIGFLVFLTRKPKWFIIIVQREQYNLLMKWTSRPGIKPL